MKISREEVLKIAKLSRLSLSDVEVGSMTGQLDAILEYVDQLKKLDTKDVEPTTQVGRFATSFTRSALDGASPRTPLRADVPRPSLPQEVAVANAPKAAGGGFVVPRIAEPGGAAATGEPS